MSFYRKQYNRNYGKIVNRYAPRNQPVVTQNPQVFVVHANTTEDQIVLQTLVENGVITGTRRDFATSLANALHPTAKQTEWITKLINEAMNESAGAATPEKVDVSNIFKMFETAKKHLKYPKISLETKAGLPIRLTFAAGNNTKYAGCFHMNSAGYGSKWYGYVESNGTIHWKASDKKDELIAFLTEFNKDPVAMAVAYGKAHSNCCFCHKELTTQESLAVGYGPECASHYGLPWGKEKITVPEIVTEVKPATNPMMEMHANQLAELIAKIKLLPAAEALAAVSSLYETMVKK